MSENEDDLGMWDEAMDEQAEAKAEAETVELEDLQEDSQGVWVAQCVFLLDERGRGELRPRVCTIHQ